MESSTPDCDTLCELCLALHVKFWNKVNWKGETASAQSTHSLFHAPCDHCNEAAFECVVQLCDFCQHLRFRHLLLCSPRLFPDRVSLFIQPPKEKSDHCDLCKFWIDSINSLHEDAAEEEYKLYINGHESFRILSRDTTSGHNTRMGAGENREWVRPYIDWDWSRDWLHESPQPEINKHTNVRLHQGLNNVLVIGVMSNCVVRLPPNSQYVALSYVWGSNSDDQICCLRSNLSILLQAGALKDIGLPRTISDALLVCQKINYKFLWVDRLCIVQDDTTEEISKQLNQMADIYYGAALTLVAATGDSAAHGLAGVSYARNAQQLVCKYGGDFELVTPTPWLGSILGESKWWTRAWTFQEHFASRRLLFFTDYGLHLKNGLGMSKRILAEGFSEGGELHDEELDLCLLKNYTQRNLTKETDILYAASGFLRSLYGDRLSYGMPWDDFNNAILWTPTTFDRGPRASTSTDVFPTWSWISSIDPITLDMGVEPVYSLAYWGRPTTGTATASGSRCWLILEPTYYHPMSSATYRLDKNRAERYVVAALSWLHGCIKTEVPPCLLVDCAGDDYAARLEERWSKPPSPFWKEAFQGYRGIFDKFEYPSGSKAGCLLVHTQRASFVLDWRGRQKLPDNNGRTRPGRRSIIIRNDKNEIAGTFEFSKHSAQRLQQSDETHATFIALSTGSSWYIESYRQILSEYIDEHFSHLDIGAFYGCPCSSAEWNDSRGHNAECPEHANFHVIEPVGYSAWAYKSGDQGTHRDREQAYAHHLAKLSYHDVNNNLFHRLEHPPFLWVMLIAPRGRYGVGSKVYERLAVGMIYLKRWVEASPVFETLALV